MPETDPGEITIYAVGLLRDLSNFVHSPNRPAARRALRFALSYPLRQARAGDWRAVKNYLNGYLAEPVHDVPGFTRCGTGWTRGRAYRSLMSRLPNAAQETDHA